MEYYYNYDQCLKVLDQELQSISFFAKWHGYQSRIKDKRYKQHYQNADDLCGQIIRLRHGG